MAIDYKKVYKEEDAPQIWREFYKYKKLYSADEYLSSYSLMGSFKGFIMPNGDVLPIESNKMHWEVADDLLYKCGISEDELREKNKKRFSFDDNLSLTEDLYFENHGGENWLINSQGIIRMSAGIYRLQPKFPCKYYYGKKISYEQEEVINKFLDCGILEEDDYILAKDVVRDLERKFEGFRLRDEVEEAQEK